MDESLILPNGAWCIVQKMLRADPLVLRWLPQLSIGALAFDGFNPKVSLLKVSCRKSEKSHIFRMFIGALIAANNAAMNHFSAN